MGKKPFIDRKTAKHFQVVHRSQRDARIADAESSPYVLKEVPISANIARQQQEEQWTSEEEEDKEESASETEEEDEASSALDGGNIASEFGFSLPTKQKKQYSFLSSSFLLLRGANPLSQ